MGKAPAFQFYVRDWLGDPALQAASASTRGIWINALCFMWESETRGEISATVKGLERLLGATHEEMLLFFAEAEDLKFGNIIYNGDVTDGNTKVTIRNRRMTREEEERKKTRNRVFKHRERKAKDFSNPPCNGDVTVPSSSSTSSTDNNNVPNGTLSREPKEQDIPPPPKDNSKRPKRDPPPYKEIIEYLNEKAGKSYDYKLPEYQRLIRARWNHGKTLDDFKRVIDLKASKWLRDPKMLDFLRPQTLFGTKFDSYLNEQPHYDGIDEWVRIKEAQCG